MAFWRRAGILFGAITTSVPLWPYIRKALEWGEHGEFILHRVHDIQGIGPVLETILTPALWQPLVLTPLGLFVLWLALRRGGKQASKTQTMVAPAVAPDAVQIEFRWQPGGASHPYEVNAIVTANQTLKDFALIGNFATDAHYANGTAKWIWEPSIRLLKLDDFYKGEAKGFPVINCPRTGDSLMIFNERTVGIKEDKLILVRVTAISETGTVYLQKAYNVQRSGAAIIFNIISLDDIPDIKGAETPVVTRVASAPIDETLRPKAAPRYTAYDLENRLRATDEFFEFFETVLQPTYIAGRDFINNIKAEARKDDILASVDALSDRIERDFIELHRMTRKYEYLPDVFNVVAPEMFNHAELIGQCDDLREELRQLLFADTHEVNFHLDRSFVVHNWRQKNQEFSSYIEGAKERLKIKRGEYVSAEVYRG
ncbi:MAG: hypothetical protein QOJ86_968 [Bradyrhizobium sp.]|jgi:hypothetical protein|nr:hypothetical protein [Bradyrhizobium sp.]